METESEIYEFIGSNIIESSTDDQWMKAVLKIRIIVDSVDFNLNFIDQSSNKTSTDFQKAFHTSRAIKKLRELMKSYNSEKWNVLTFTLESNNKFNVDFKWCCRLFLIF